MHCSAAPDSAADRTPAGAARGRVARLVVAFAPDERWTRRATYALIGLTAVVLARTAWICDDAYITLRTVDNFVHGYGLRWNIAERVQTFTHPLWLFVLTIPYAVTREPYYTSIAPCMLATLACVSLLAFGARARPAAALAGVGLLLFSRAFVDYSTSGLENALTHLLLTLFLLLLTEEAPDDRRLFMLAAVAGLGVLNRIDAGLLYAPGLVFALVRHRRVKGVWWTAAGLAPFLLWELFATFYYGIPYPNTALAKLDTGIGAGALARQGLFYLLNSLRTDPVTLVVIAAALAAAAWRRQGREIAIALGVALHLLYLVRIGGDFMSGRFLSAPFVAAVVLLVQVDFFPVRHAALATLAAVAALALVATPHPSLWSGSGFAWDRAELIDRHGIADERRYYFSHCGLFNGMPGWRRPAHWSIKPALDARRARTPLMVEGAVGFGGYYCGPDVHFVDYHALGDPLLSRLPVVERDEHYLTSFEKIFGASPLGTWRIGHFRRNVPKGYLKTILTGRNQLADPRLARLYDEIALVTRGPLWDRRRIAAIFRLNRGADDDLIDPTRPKNEPVPWDEVIEVRPDVAEAYYERSTQRLIAGDADGGRQDLERAVALDPRHGAAVVALGDLHRKQSPERALEYYARASEADPEDPAPLLRTADLLLARGENQRVIDVSQRVLSLDPTLSSAYNNIGLAHAKLGDFHEAVRWLTKAVTMDPDIAGQHDNLGYALLGLGDERRALTEFQKALSLKPGFESALYHAANAYALTGDTKTAIAMMERAIAANPKNAESYFRLGDLVASAGNHERALDLWRQAARLGFEPARKALTARGLTW